LELNIKGFKLKLDFSEQLSPHNRPIRLSGTQSVGHGIWVNKRLYTGTIHWFRYLDKWSEFVGFEFDEYGVFKRTVRQDT
jgi:hypothetical protein